MKFAKAKAASAAPKSVIDTILEKLDPGIHIRLFGTLLPNDDPRLIARRRSALIADGEEALRILRVRQALFIPRSNDTAMIRAALVIDYLSRNARDICDSAPGNGYLRMTIPLAALGRVVGKDTKKLEKMVTVMAAYLDGASIGRKRSVCGNNIQNDNVTQKRSRTHGPPSLRQRPSQTEAVVATFSSHAPGPTFPPSDLIRDLCIQLGPLIPDAEFASSYAMRLLNSLTNVTERQASSKRRFSRHELRRDMERHREYYEAACFYLAAKESEGGDSAQCLKNLSGKKNASKQVAKKVFLGKNDGDNENSYENEADDEGGDDQLLREADVVHSANLLEGTFMAVLDSIRDWVEGIPISMDLLPGGGDCGHADRSDGGAYTKTLFQVASSDDRSGISQLAAAQRPFISSFGQWKDKVLRDARLSAMKKITDAGGKNSSDWLTIAADEALHKAGL